jgi:uncharacterized repeat protein (TIGR03803 family)
MSITTSRAVLASLAAVLVLAAPGWSQTFKVLYNFSGSPDGAGPMGVPLVSGGVLYGTTSTGGAYGYGSVFSLDLSTAHETVLYSFDGITSGAYPQAGLIQDTAGNLYGTTLGISGYGTVFEISASGAASVLHSFAGPDGLSPYGKLVGDGAGNLYGTTSAGGAGSYGTVFKLDKAGDLTTLKDFTGEYDGGSPFDGLVPYQGLLYGTSNGAYIPGGPPYLGTVFAVSPNKGSVTLYHFGEEGKGTLPVAGVVPYGDGGNFYGTTLYTQVLFGGDGVVYQLNIRVPEYTVLHTFAGGPADGSGPTGGVVVDAAGNLYGTTDSGGTYGAGIVYQITSNRNETILHSFSGADGQDPWAGLTMDAQGILYGVTNSGGTYGAGVVFAIKP